MIDQMPRQLVSIICFLVIGTSLYAQPEKVFATYLAALKSSDYAAAADCWTPQAIKESQRLGITFTGLPEVAPKYDNASPITSSLDAVRAGKIIVSCAETRFHDDWAEMTVVLRLGADSSISSYYFERINDEWRITAPLFIHSRGWSSRTTEYAQVFYRDSTLLNDYALVKLDDFISSVGTMLSISSDRMSELAERKIAYFLGDADNVQKLTGFQTYGMANLQFDAVITRYLPHPHELTHLMINYAYKDIPLYTLPALQEGLACCWGGRWGKSPQVITQMGRFILHDSLMALDSILTWRGFNQAGLSDVTYPASALFVHYLLGNYNPRQFFQMYRELSGSSLEMTGLSLEDIHGRIQRIYGHNWTDIETSFTNSFQEALSSGISPGSSSELGDTLLEARTEHFSLVICDGGSCYSVAVKDVSDGKSATLLLSGEVPAKREVYQSHLFKEHAPDKLYEGEWYGLRFSRQDAGLYDYRTNCLEAKYVLQFEPSDSYWSAADSTVRFIFDKKLLPESLLQYRYAFVE